MPEQPKVPPHSIDAEKSILGSCLIDNNACYYALDKLNKNDFYHGAHRSIYGHISQLVSEGSPVDMVTLTQKLNDAGELEDVGGAHYIASLAESTPTSAHIDHYCNLVKNKAVMRRLINIGNVIVKHGYKDEAPEDFINWAQQQIIGVIQNNNDGMQSFSEVALAGALENMIEGESRDDAIETPWLDLNNYIIGMKPKQFIVLAGRPSMGKTAFAEQIAVHTARNYGPVACFIPDMSKEEFVQRCICREANVSGHVMQGGMMEDDEVGAVMQAARELAKLPIELDDRVPTLAQVEAQAQQIKAQKGISLIVIDYLQMLEAKAENRTQEIRRISRFLKGLGKRLNIPVLALSQLSRDVERRDNKRPRMSDLRESGQVEQDADKVIFLYRDEYYNPEGGSKGTAEAIIAKQKNGPTGMVELAFIKEYMKFSDLARQEEIK